VHLQEEKNLAATNCTIVMYSVRCSDCSVLLMSCLLPFLAPHGFYGYSPQSPTIMPHHQGVPVNTITPPFSPVAMVNYGPQNAGGRTRDGKLLLVLSDSQESMFNNYGK